MKNRFIVRNFLFLLFPMLLPVLLLNFILIFNSYNTSRQMIEYNMENIVFLTNQSLEMMLLEQQAQSLILNGTGRISASIVRLFNNDNLDYEDSLAAKYLTTMLSAQVDVKEYLFSIYMYMPNAHERIITSDNGFTTLMNISDTGWYSIYLNGLKPGKSLIVRRFVKNPAIDGKQVEVITILRSVENQNSVVVTNYNTDYFYDILNSYTNYENQGIIVLNEGEVFISNKFGNTIDEASLKHVLNNSNERLEYKFGETEYVFNKKELTNGRFTLISYIPKNLAYAPLYDFIIFALLLLLVTVIITALLSLYISNKNYKQLHEITNLFYLAEQNREIPPLSRKKDEYSYILNNIIKTFLESSYLKIQLSEKKYKQHSAELMALQYQINPHFLYNALQTIDYEIMSITRKRVDANLMIESLSDFLRYSLDNPFSSVTLADEIKNTKNYICIQKARYEERFNVDWRYDEAILDKKIIRLILQPLIENSINHGVKDREECMSAIHIVVKIKPLGDKIKITVADNGVGICKENLVKIIRELCIDEDNETFSQWKGTHIGLFNCNRRLTLKYGNVSRLHIYSKFGMGTLATFLIPTDIND